MANLVYLKKGLGLRLKAFQSIAITSKLPGFTTIAPYTTRIV